jgi:hypothetical protein
MMAHGQLTPDEEALAWTWPGAATYTDDLARAAADARRRPNVVNDDPPGPLDQRIRDAFPTLDGGSGYVALDRIRDHFPDVPRTDIDNALARLYDSPDVQLEPEANRKTLLPQDWDASITVGGEVRHLLHIDPKGLTLEEAQAAFDRWDEYGRCDCRALPGTPCQNLRIRGAFNSTPHDFRPRLTTSADPAGTTQPEAGTAPDRSGLVAAAINGLERLRDLIQAGGRDHGVTRGVAANILAGLTGKELDQVGAHFGVTAMNGTKDHKVRQIVEVTVGFRLDSAAISASDRGDVATRAAAARAARPPRSAPEDPGHPVRKALTDIPDDQWTSIADVRDAMAAAGLSRPEQDTALEDMLGQPDIRIIPTANLKSLTDREFNNGFKIGGEDSHMIQRVGDQPSYDEQQARADATGPYTPTGPYNPDVDAAVWSGDLRGAKNILNTADAEAGSGNPEPSQA